MEEGLEDFKEGNFVLIHDSSKREDETDMVLAAEKTRPEHVARMRRDGGGLICVAIHPKVADEIGLPYLSKIYKSASTDYEILNSAEADDLPYDEHSSFSISVNYRDTFTGITDKDRALTIRKLGEMSSKVLEGNTPNGFGEKFRTPGHVPILRAADGLLKERSGHTELSIALTEMAGTSPSTVVCEMLDDESNEALSGKKAKENGLTYLEKKEIQESYENQKGGR